LENEHLSSTRRRRQASDEVMVTEKFNDGEDVVFYIGFRLDGHKVYENISEELPEYSQLNVYESPTIERLAEGTLLFRTYWPHNDRSIDIKVCSMQDRCKVKHFLLQQQKPLDWFIHISW